MGLEAPHPSWLRAEDELLLRCAPTRLSSELNGNGNPVRENLDWSYLISSAAGHGMLPLLYRYLQSAGPEAAPADYLDDLRVLYRRNERHSALLTQALREILALCDERGIIAVPLKGPALALALYGDAALRQFNDLDILVRREDFAPVKRLLVSRGYAAETEVTDVAERTWLRWGHVRTFRRDDAAAVELHWDMVPTWFSAGLDGKGLWRRLVRLQTAEGSFWSLAPEDLVPFLCVHGIKHQWERLSWLCDLAQLMRVFAAIDWEMVARSAEERGSERSVYLGLFLAQSLLHAPAPGSLIRRAASDSEVMGLARDVERRLFAPRRPWPGGLDDCLFHLRAMRRSRDRVGYCLRRAFALNEKDFAWSLPDPLRALYYPLRGGRLVREMWGQTRGLVQRFW